LGIPRIVRGDSTVLRKRPWWVGGLHRLLLSWFDAFLFVGKSNREFYSRYGIPEDRLFACHHFVDNERFASQLALESKGRAASRSAWKVPDASTCFLFAGKIERIKRVMDLLRALEVAVLLRPRIHLLVAGTGECLAEARRFVASRGLPVTFAGFLNQTEITRAYATADCLVLPSESETWGLVVNEAMVCGLPALVSDQVGCAPDLVREGVTGGVFPCGDVDALASKLAEFAADPEKLERMGERARELIKDYSVDQAVAGTLAAVEFVVRKSVCVQQSLP
jgi:glycosyltransferase involved in cell wall biosynthesis